MRFIYETAIERIMVPQKMSMSLFPGPVNISDYTVKSQDSVDLTNKDQSGRFASCFQVGPM